MDETTIDVLRIEGELFIEAIEGERQMLARLGGYDAADDIADLSHMARQLADRLHSVASQTMTYADEVRVKGCLAGQPPRLGPPRPTRSVHREELAAEARGEHEVAS